MTSRALPFILTVLFAAVVSTSVPNVAADAPAAAKASTPAAAAATTKSADVKPEEMQGVSFDGLSNDALKLALELLKQNGCDCGCGMKLDVCRRDDPKCPRSLPIVTEVIAMAKAGKSRDEITKKALSSPTKFVQFVIPAGNAPAIGPADAKVTILHYYDYQCPFCVKIGPTIEQILTEYPKDVRVVFKQRPLPMHPNAPLASEAVLAANAQGKFIEMHRKIYANPRDLSRERYIAYAKEIGLDIERFTKELDTHAYAAEAAKQSKEAEDLGASGTPASFVNGRFVSGAKPFDFFKAMIDEELGWARAGNRPKFTNGKNVAEASNKAKGPDPNKVYSLPAGKAPSAGPADAKVTILHYTDYQCPVCVMVHPTMDKIAAAYPKDVRIVYKMRPLNIHAQAMIAAEAALAAHAQGKFFEMHNKLFENSKMLSRDRIFALAQELGLDMKRFTSELDSHKYKPEIDAVVGEVVAIGATGTPTSFVNGRFIVGAQPFDIFKKMVDEELAKTATKTAAAGS